MTDAIINTPVNIAAGESYTAEAGSQRRVVFASHGRKDSGAVTWSCTLGGVAMTKDYETAYSGDDVLVWFSLKEADIPSGAQTLAPLATGGTGANPNLHGVIYTLRDRDQTTALDAGFTSNGAATATGGVTSASLTNAAGSILMASVRNSAFEAVTLPDEDWTEQRADLTSGLVSFQHRDDAPAATAAYEWTGDTANWLYGTVAYKAAEADVVTITGFRLIDKAGAPVVSATGITALIYKSVPSSLVAPDKRIASVTTNGSGTLMDLDISDIQSNDDDVWLTLMLDGSPAKGTTVKVTPVVT